MISDFSIGTAKSKLLMSSSLLLLYGIIELILEIASR
jgi:hypothetical protein